MDVTRAFTYVTEDERWVGKIGIGAIVSLASFLIIPIFLLPGYLVGITRNVMNGEERPLPEWEDFGQLLGDGFNIAIANLVYTLPFWLLTCIAFFATGGIAALTESTNFSDEAAVASLFATFGVVGCLGLIFAVALFFISPAIVLQYVREGNLGACFRFGEVIGIARDNIGDIAIAGLAPFAVALGLGIVTTILNFIPCLGQIAAVLISIAAGPYMSAVSGHLYGQIGAKLEGGVSPKFAE